MRPTFPRWLQGGGMRGPQGGKDGSIRGAPGPSFMGPYAHLYYHRPRGNFRVHILLLNAHKPHEIYLYRRSNIEDLTYKYSLVLYNTNI